LENRTNRWTKNCTNPGFVVGHVLRFEQRDFVSAPRLYVTEVNDRPALACRGGIALRRVWAGKVILFIENYQDMTHHSNDLGSPQQVKKPAWRSKQAKGKISIALQEGFQMQGGWESLAIRHALRKPRFPARALIKGHSLPIQLSLPVA
jgi:hypothetical protein